MIIIVGLCLSYTLGCSRFAQGEREGSSTADPSSNASSDKTAATQKKDDKGAEPKGPEAKSVEPQVQSEIGRIQADKQAGLLKDAQLALEETRNAMTKLDQGDKNAALAALERASGKLDLVVSRDPKLALAPVDVTTSILDLYATPDTVKAVIKEAKDDLSRNQFSSRVTC
jgi:hypothetical protein